jgi:DNA-binding transcriptional MocR family regulator
MKMMGENELTQEILDKVKEAAEDNRMSCPVARKLADDLGVANKTIGDACNELDIKIKNCSLGCF